MSDFKSDLIFKTYIVRKIEFERNINYIEKGRYYGPWNAYAGSQGNLRQPFPTGNAAALFTNGKQP